MLAASLPLALVAFFASFSPLVVKSVKAHAAIVGVHGANGITGLGFGVNRFGKFPRAPGKAGGDVSVFNTDKPLPNPPCGTTGELGVVDSLAWFSQQEGLGVPTAYPNGSVVLTLFQVNRDGGGPAYCDFSTDASLSDASWAPLVMDLNEAGNEGIAGGVDRNNQTLVATFPKNAKCSGGIGGDTCIARCRTGVNVKTDQLKRFGGCFAVKLAAHMGGGGDSQGTAPAAGGGTTPAGQGRTVGAGNSVVFTAPASGGSGDLSNQEFNAIVQAVVQKMQQQGMVLKSKASKPKKAIKAVKPGKPKARSARHHHGHGHN